MKVRRVIWAAAGATALLLVGVWFFFIRSDAPPPAALEDAVAAVSDNPAAAADSGAGGTGTDGIDGSWSIDAGLSFAGYRIGEELASIGTATAVGRTSDLEGIMNVAGSTVTELTVTVDMTTLRSDRSRRDSAMRTRGLETDAFPTAGFVLTGPLELGNTPGEGDSIAVTATGELTLHGTSNTVSLDLEGSVVDGSIVVVGSTEVVLSDYQIEAPVGFSVISIAATGTIEVQLVFTRR